MKQKQLHIVLFPFMAHGHMIPMLDMAKLFTSRGLKTTIISTLEFAEPIKQSQESGHEIGLRILKFPPEGSELPDHIVSASQALSVPDLRPLFMKSLELLRAPLDDLLEELDPDCLVSDMFLPWTVDSADKRGIPRFVFHGTSCFALCAKEQMMRHRPYKNVSSDSETFVLPDLPDRFEFVRTQVADYVLPQIENDFTSIRERMFESEKRSYGVVINSFEEIESAYADHYKNFIGKRAWHIGPLLLINETETTEKRISQRGKESATDEEHECLAWLDSKNPNSVVYISFGTMTSFARGQLHELATGLESSGRDFIWVLRKPKNDDGNEDWLPQGYEERLKDRGLIIRGWAPQVMILNHPSTGAFVTHCGWNSTLESICAGVPMITWPIFAEQFYNEKLVTDVLKIGVSVGSKKWQRSGSDGVKREAITKAVNEVTIGEKASEMSNRAKEYKGMARKSVREGGSSYSGLDALIEDLSSYRP